MKSSLQKRSITQCIVSVSAVAILWAISLSILPPVLADDKPGQLLRLINQYRQSQGLSQLKHLPQLTLAAQRHCNDMVRKNYFSHCDPDKRCLKWRLQRVGYRPRVWAENLAAGLQDPEKVVKKWIDSPEHHQILINREVVHAGIGYNPDTIKDMSGIWTLVVTAPL